MMIAYHFCFDLSFFGMLRADFNHDTGWLAARALIVSLFAFLVGVSLTLADRHPSQTRHFAWRELRIGLCAIVVSGASYMMFPRSFIFFGILHFIFVASLVGWGLLRARLGAAGFAVLGVVALALGIELNLPLFDLAPLQWVGFMTHKPDAEDYVPLFPWIGVVFLGIACGKWLKPGLNPAPGGQNARVATGGLPQALGWMGRHSLAIYMLHQPMLLGALYLLNRR